MQSWAVPWKRYESWRSWRALRYLTPRKRYGHGLVYPAWCRSAPAVSAAQGALPGRFVSHQGRAAVSSASNLQLWSTAVVNWTDNHCHLHDATDPGWRRGRSRCGARNGACTTMITVGCDAATSLAAIAVAERVRRGVGHRWLAPPRRESTGSTPLCRCFDHPR